MYLSPRDRQILQLLGQLRQLTAAHVRALVFTGNQSETPAYRALNRLTKNGLIRPIQQKVVGGVNGGAGAYVYMLTDQGRRLTGAEDRRATVDFHAIEVASTVVRLKQLERLGIATLTRYETEPTCWRTIGGVELQPDLYAEVQLPNGYVLVQFCEVDLGTEGLKQVGRKLELYASAWENADVDVFPRVIWIAVDDVRRAELQKAVELVNVEARALFVVTTLERLGELYL